MGNQPDIYSKEQLAKKYPNPSNGNIYTIGDGRQYIYIGSNKWEQLGVNYNYLSKRFIPSGCTFSSLSNYIAISEWNKLVSACSQGVQDALDIIINKKAEPRTTNFDEFFTYCINAGIDATSAITFAKNNYKLIQQLPSTIISSIVSGGVLNDYLNNYISNSSVIRSDFNNLSANYDTLVNKLISNQAELQQNLSTLQIQLDNVNANLSSVYINI